MVQRKDQPDWQHFQDRVAEVFNQTPGWVARVNQLVRGSHGSHQVDVFAEFSTVRDPEDTAGPFHRRAGRGFVFKVIVECKLWKRRIPQKEVFALKTIVDDVGAAMGILISEVGVQRGAAEYLDHPVNLFAFTFAEFQSMVTGRPMVAKPLVVPWRGRFGPRTMAITACARCGVKIQVPFPPPSGRPLYCRECI